MKKAMITFAAIFAMSFSTLQIATIPLGGGTSEAVLQPENVPQLLKVCLTGLDSRIGP